MATNQNILQDKFDCLDCGKIFKNERELEIHSFMHSSCGEIIFPIFKTSEANFYRGIFEEEWESVKSTLHKESLNKTEEKLSPSSKKIKTVHSSSVTSFHSNPTLKDCVQVPPNISLGHSMGKLPFSSVDTHMSPKVKNQTDTVKNQTDTVKNQTDTVKNQTDTVKNQTDTMKKQTNIVGRRRPWLRCDACQERFASARGLETHKCKPLPPTFPGLKKFSRKVFFLS